MPFLWVASWIMNAMAVWALVLPGNLATLTANDRAGWRVRAHTTADLREWGKWAARRARWPACERAWVALVVYPNTRRKFDASNWSPTAKALIDGALVDGGVLVDDDNQHLPLTSFASGPVWRGQRKRVVLYVTDERPERADWWSAKEREVLDAQRDT